MNASYRLQFNQQFTFQKAMRLIPYLQKLGISHCYASPLLKARQGSEHGYDVVDYHSLNPEIGTLEEFKEMVFILKSHKMRLIFDFVPNHMFILDPENRYWYDVLKYGQNSLYASYFDIEWNDGQLILPFLEKEDQDPEYIRKKYQFPESDHYKLILWEKGNNQVNYRRFFDHFHYAALCCEKEIVFQEIHQFLFKLLEEKLIDIVRIDHIDGLKDPETYLRKLQKKCPKILVEKVLLDTELLRPWPILGTVGYEFLTCSNAFFVEKTGYTSLISTYKNFTKKEIHPYFIYKYKKYILETSFQSEFNRLTVIFPTLKQEIKTLLSSFSVYRTYITEEKMDIWDKKIVDEAFETAQKIYPEGKFENLKNYFFHSNFCTKLQLLMPALTAKGIEDTALYDFFPLVSMNEVGYDFTTFSICVNDFHKQNKYILNNWPYTLLATSTHDTKRSEDVRSRLHVLSEIPNIWEKHLSLWSSLNPKIDSVPAANEEYLLYQTLIGMWPIQEITPEWKNRIQQYMEKATKEQKRNTSWIKPNKIYHKNLSQFIKNLFDNKLFLSSMQQFVNFIIPFGLLNSLSQLLLKLTCPGIADIYQGNETWQFNLVDPDNRRTVDFESLQNVFMPDTIFPLLENFQDGRIKRFIIETTLNLRIPPLALYRPLNLPDKRLIAYYRIEKDFIILVITARFFTSFMKSFSEYSFPPWEHIWIPCQGFKNVLTGEFYEQKTSLQKILSPLPFALLQLQPGRAAIF